MALPAKRPELMDKHLAATVEYTARQTANSLEMMGRTYRADRKRVRGLRLFADRAKVSTNGVQSMPRTHLRATDRPEIELILHRVQDMERLRERLTFYDKHLRDQLNREDIGRVLGILVKLEDKLEKHLTAIEHMFNALSKESGSREQALLSAALKMSQLCQQLQMHRDGKGDFTDTDIVKHLAEKYSISEEQVTEMLNAKDVGPASGT